jgi:protein-tyrosine-phosphatase
MTILFVCTGNTCRSPLAVAAWRALQSRGQVPRDWSAFSAGLAPNTGEAASQHVLDIAQNWGVDLSGHHSRGIDEGALRQVDVCMALTSAHAKTLGKMLRALDNAPRVLCLSDFVPRSPEADSIDKLLGGSAKAEITDPYGGSREAYESCASLIEAAVAQLARALQEENGGAQSSTDAAQHDQT